MMDEATKAQEVAAAAAAAAAAAPAEPMVDETMAEVEQGLRQEITVTIDEQDAVQKMRAEASVLGERLGLGNMQVRLESRPLLLLAAVELETYFLFALFFKRHMWCSSLEKRLHEPLSVHGRGDPYEVER